ncbi:hypothetical protein GCM10027425_28920 [Alteromonas gracilis]
MSRAAGRRGLPNLSPMTATPQRRALRSPRHTAALGLLLLATTGVLVSLALRLPVLTAYAAVGAAAAGWVAVRLMWGEVVRARVQHAQDRADMARGYRVLFAARSADHADFVSTMARRLGDEREARAAAEEAVVAATTRAGAAELGLARAGHRIVVLEHELLDLTVERRVLEERLEEQERTVEDLRRNRPPAPTFPVDDPADRVAVPPVPEWTDPRWISQIDPDPTASLLAWEAHVRARSGAAEPRHRRHA